MGSKKKILIIFPDEWLSYSPTILNLLELFSKNDEVTLVYIDNNMFNNKKIQYLNTQIVKVDINKFFYRILAKLRLYKLYKLISLFYSVNLLKKKIIFDNVIGVDSVGYLAGRLIFKRINFLSLEVENSLFMSLCKRIGIKNLIIQSKERADYLSLKKETVVQFLQNSPIVKNSYVAKEKPLEKKLLYFGNILKAHGIEECIEALLRLDRSYTLTLKGIDKSQDSYLETIRIKYKSLISEDRLLIDTTYISQNEILDYIRNFYIGFCFYNFEITGKENFNYLSSPSGKLFNYLATGVPSICSEIIGIEFLENKSCGILLKTPSTNNILQAIQNIDSSYEKYSLNSVKEFANVEFEKQFRELILY